MFVKILFEIMIISTLELFSFFCLFCHSYLIVISKIKHIKKQRIPFSSQDWLTQKLLTFLVLIALFFVKYAFFLIWNHLSSRYYHIFRFNARVQLTRTTKRKKLIIIRFFLVENYLWVWTLFWWFFVIKKSIILSLNYSKKIKGSLDKIIGSLVNFK